MLGPLFLRRWYRLLGAAPLIMLVAMVPGLFYVDHWLEYLGLTAEASDGAMEHIGHCHLSPASCSDQPLPPDLSATPAVVHVVEPELTSFALEDEQGSRGRSAERASSRAGTVIEPASLIQKEAV